MARKNKVGPSDPATDGAAVTTSDSATIEATRSLYVGSGGDVKIRTLEGNDVTFVAVPTGAILPIQVDKVYATGTSAASIVALY